MRLLAIIFLIPIYLCLCGYVSLQNQSDEYYIDKLKQHDPSVLIVQSTYPEAFKATVNIFRDLNINILKKDFQTKMILGAYYAAGSFAAYGAFFEDDTNGRTKISIRVHGAWFGGEYIIKKIKDEIELQKKI